MFVRFFVPVLKETHLYHLTIKSNFSETKLRMIHVKCTVDYNTVKHRYGTVPQFIWCKTTRKRSLAGIEHALA